MASRRYADALPDVVAAYAGDTLWANMVFWLFALVMRRAGTTTLVACALAFSFAIEISQLYHAPWIDAIRATSIGALVLGSGFVWSDLACYTVGVGLGGAIDVAVRSTGRAG